MGVENDAGVERIQFEIPVFGDRQTALIYWQSDDYADVDALEDGIWTVSQRVTQCTGDLICHIAVTDNDKVMWHSADFIARVTNLADIDGRIDQLNPGLIMKCLNDVGGALNTMNSMAEMVNATAGSMQHSAYLSMNESRAGRVYQRLTPLMFDVYREGYALTRNGAAIEAEAAQDWDICRYALPYRMVLRIDGIEENPDYECGVQMAYERDGVYYELSAQDEGNTILADALLINGAKKAAAIARPEAGDDHTLEPADFILSDIGVAMVDDDGSVALDVDAEWSILRCALSERQTIRIDEVTAGETTGVLSIVRELDGRYYECAEGEIAEADALRINCQSVPVEDQPVGEAVTLTPADFDQVATGRCYEERNGKLSQMVVPFGRIIRYRLDAGSNIYIDTVTEDPTVIRDNMVYGAFKLNGEYHKLDASCEGAIIRADELYINGVGDRYAITSLSYVPYGTVTVNNYSIVDVTYSEMTYEDDTAITRAGYSINGVSLTADVRREFENAVIITDKITRIDGIVCFGDGIAYGYMEQDGEEIAQGNGVMQQLAGIFSKTLTNCAVKGATLGTAQASPKPVVKQVEDWTPPANKKPLVIIQGGGNDSFENLGEFGSDDDETVYGAMNGMIDTLTGNGIEPWQILILTPIPMFTSDEAAKAENDSRLTAIGNAMYQVGVYRGCNVINGYRAIFGDVDSAEMKTRLMEDGVHPTEVGAKYYAHYIYRSLVHGLNVTIMR